MREIGCCQLGVNYPPCVTLLSSLNGKIILTNVCMRAIGCFQLGVHNPLWVVVQLL